MSEPNESYISVAKIVTSHGVKGFAKVLPLTDYPERLKDLDIVFLFDQNSNLISKTRVEKVKFNNKIILIKLRFFDSPEKVKEFRNTLIKIPESEKLDLPDDEFYIDDLKGVNVYSESGESIGVVNDVYTLAQDILEIKKLNGKIIMVPFVKDLVIDINLNDNRVIIKNLSGLI